MSVWLIGREENIVCGNDLQITNLLPDYSGGCSKASRPGRVQKEFLGDVEQDLLHR